LAASAVTDMSDFSEMIERLSCDGICPVLCLDEFEAAMQNLEELNERFLDALRALGSQAKLAMVTASRRSLEELGQASQLKTLFPNIFSQIELGLMESGAAQALRRVPFEQQGKSFSPEDETLVEELAGRHPFFLQMACHHLYETLSEPQYVRTDIVRERFNHDAKMHFDGLWDRLNASERSALKVVIGQAICADETERALQWLARLGVVEKTDGGWRVFSVAFAEHLRRCVAAAELTGGSFFQRLLKLLRQRNY
jgi:hypothetical protein